MQPRVLCRALLAWYTGAKRDLPWRRTRDPWAIWVSEVMLQQTRVETVREPYAAFLARFPTPRAFAEASDDELLAAWRGLGYYRRARLLRDAARSVVADHDGNVPDDAQHFGALPGVGDYTRGAVMSIAFGAPEPAIDGNVERVMSRLLALSGDPKRAPFRERVGATVRALFAYGPPSEINQALMELGALVCAPSSPSCLLCPWQRACAARASGDPTRFPVASKDRRTTPVVTAVCVARRGRDLLARRVPRGEVNEGQLCLPGLGLPQPVAEDLGAHLRAAHGLAADFGEPLCSVRHTITRYRIRVDAYAPSPLPRRRNPGRGLLWADATDPALPWSTIVRKVLRSLARRAP